MKYELIVFKNWHFDRTKFLTPATYRVPEEVSEEMAERAIKENAGKRIDRMKLKAPAPENKLASVEETKDDPIKKKDQTGPMNVWSSPRRGRPKGKKTSN